MIKFTDTKSAINGNTVTMSVPISKIDVEKRMVHGFATLDNLDKQNDVVDMDASIKAFSNFRNNLREMHQPISVGKIVSFKPEKYFDEGSQKFYNGVYVSAYVSKGAQNTWEKVVDGTLTGFSIGGEINETEDFYDEDMNKSYRIIKEYSLSELSLVDNPANQFANVISIEKSHDGNHLNGYLSKATIENVFWCRKDDVVSMSYDGNRSCPQCDKAMSNIGFVEANDTEKSLVVGTIISDIKKNEIQEKINDGYFVKFEGQYGQVIDIVMQGGARLSSDQNIMMAKNSDPVAIVKLYSENNGTITPTRSRVIKNVSSLENINAINKSKIEEVGNMDSNIVVIDEIEKGVDSDQEAVSPEPTSLPVVEETTKADNEVKEEEVEKVKQSDDSEDEADDDDMDDDDDVTKKSESSTETKEDETAKMISEISESLTSALSSLAETVKALDARIDGITKSVAGVSGEVDGIKNSFGKRVDAVEKETAFRKSADLGEILQEEPIIVEKSTWGGRFLKSTDLF